MAPSTQKTPAKAGKDTNTMKQKSLMSFFSKAPGAPSTTESKTVDTPQKPLKAGNTSKTDVERVRDDTSSDPPAPEARTPLSKNASQSSIVYDAGYTRSSDGAESYVQTPPTSDPIDVDMLSAEEDDAKAKTSAKAAVRSKLLCVDLY